MKKKILNPKLKPSTEIFSWRKNEMRRLAVLAILAALTLNSWCFAQTESEANQCENFDSLIAETGAKELTLTMQSEHEDVNLRVPNVYYTDASLRATAVRDGSFMFRIDPDDYSPLSLHRLKANLGDFRMGYAIVLVTDYRPMDDLLSRTMKQRNIPDWKLLAGTESQDAPGLIVLYEGNRDKMSADGRAVLVNSDYKTSHVKTLLRCDSPDDPHLEIPFCQMFLRSGAVDASVDFPRDRLPNWLALKIWASSFIECAQRK